MAKVRCYRLSWILSLTYTHTWDIWTSQPSLNIGWGWGGGKLEGSRKGGKKAKKGEGVSVQ